jgi:hypothetical protein
VRWRQLVVVGLAATSVCGATAAAAEAVTIITVSQNTASSQTQTGRISRDGITSSCAAPTSAPSVIQDEFSFRYVNHTLRSRLANPVCVEVDIDSTCSEIFSVAYAGAFDPANPRTRYAADMGALTGWPTYSLTVAAGSPFSVVVHEVSVSAPCGAYTITFRSQGPWAAALPSMAGNPAVGNVLTGTDANWVATPAVQRRWLRCDAAGASCTAIPGATGATYTVTDADLGRTLRFRNDATDADATNGSQSAFVEPYIPFDARASESLGPGDRAHNGVFVRNNIESRCGVPTSPPTILQPATSFLYDAVPVRSLLNEPVCLIARSVPTCVAGVTSSIYNPAFAPASGLTANYAGNSGVSFDSEAAVSAILPAAKSREVIVSTGALGGSCASYGLTLGADAPFASSRPSVSGSPVEGGTLTASNGAWSGTPAFSHSWLRCDGAGANCTLIANASGASYTPTAADVGARLRARVTARRGRSVSSDSEPTGVVGGDPVGGDRRAPKATLALARTTLQKVVKRARIPVNVKCNEASKVTVRVHVPRKLRKALGANPIATGRGKCRPGKTAKLKAKLKRKARKGLRRRKSLALTLKAKATDAAGNTGTAKKKAKLRRKR